jgi:hypothetical protein
MNSVLGKHHPVVLVNQQQYSPHKRNIINLHVISLFCREIINKEFIRFACCVYMTWTATEEKKCVLRYSDKFLLLVTQLNHNHLYFALHRPEIKFNYAVQSLSADTPVLRSFYDHEAFLPRDIYFFYQHPTNFHT